MTSEYTSNLEIFAQSRSLDQIPNRIPVWKRLFDIIGASLILLLISPLFILIAILVKLESRGPIFYISKRVGFRYQIFDFYKFRSMRVNADKMVDQLKGQNQYQHEEVEIVNDGTIEESTEHDILLVSDDNWVEESHFLQEKKGEEKSAFFKVENDPRITRIGHFIRKSSIDELPQLINVIKGDMSLVGNRPLPLYEAEKLTSDEYTLRFMAPAGITGLWQINDRGLDEVSPERRKYWDIEYAKNYSLWMDLKILLKTIPAVIQKANV